MLVAADCMAERHTVKEDSLLESAIPTEGLVTMRIMRTLAARIAAGVEGTCKGRGSKPEGAHGGPERDH